MSFGNQRLVLVLLGSLSVSLVGRSSPVGGRSNSPTESGQAKVVVTGEHVFEKWCAPCHSRESPLAGPMAGTIALQAKYRGRVPAALLDRSDLTPGLINYYVRHGVGWMPPFRKTEISDRELAALGTYLSMSPGKRPEWIQSASSCLAR